MNAFVKQVLGPGITDGIELASADLGVMRYDDARKCIVSILGDNFSQLRLQGRWSGPSVICFDADYNCVGIPVPDGYVQSQISQLWGYQHIPPPQLMTILPSDFISINGRWWVYVISTQGTGHITVGEFHSSPDLVNFNPNPDFTIDLTQLNLAQMMTTLTFEVDSTNTFVYILGTGGHKRDQPIWLWRCPTGQFPDPGAWQPWGFANNSWGWGQDNTNTPVLPGSYGELCLRRFGDIWILSFFDGANYCCSALKLGSPTDDLTTAEKITFAYGNPPPLSAPVGTPCLPRLYAPMISPLSQLGASNGLEFFVSQWNTETGDPYTINLVRTNFAPKNG